MLTFVLVMSGLCPTVGVDKGLTILNIFNPRSMKERHISEVLRHFTGGSSPLLGTDLFTTRDDRFNDGFCHVDQV